MADRIRADVEKLSAAAEELRGIKARLLIQRDLVRDAAEILAQELPETARREFGDSLKAGLDACDEGCRELEKLIRFQENAVSEYREAERGAAELIEGLLL